MVGGNGQRQRTMSITFTSREESRIGGGGLKRQQGVWCCLKGISGFIDPIPPHSIPRRVPKYQGFCIVRSCRVRWSSWTFILIFKWIFIISGNYGICHPSHLTPLLSPFLQAIVTSVSLRDCSFDKSIPKWRRGSNSCCGVEVVLFKMKNIIQRSLSKYTCWGKGALA